jgi:hypothetical protein
MTAALLSAPNLICDYLRRLPIHNSHLVAILTAASGFIAPSCYKRVVPVGNRTLLAVDSTGDITVRNYPVAKRVVRVDAHRINR